MNEAESNTYWTDRLKKLKARRDPEGIEKWLNEEPETLEKAAGDWDSVVIKAAAYQEEPDSEFTHNGEKFNLNAALQKAHSAKTQQLPVDDLKWLLDHQGTPDPARTGRADLSAPLLVTTSNGRLVVLDGRHRLHKAVSQNAPSLPAKLIDEETLKEARAKRPKTEVQEASATNGVFAHRMLKKDQLVGTAFLKIRETGEGVRDWQGTHLGEHANHSDTPNAAIKVTGDMIKFYANRAIRPGEEVTVDHGSFPFQSPKSLAAVDPVRKQAAAAPAGHPEPHHVPITGPEAIEYALSKIDLDKLHEEVMGDIRSGKKTKRPDAVKILGYLEGFKRSGIHPQELIIHSVPVLPPKFRPFNVAGDTFIPGDANELYRDLINVRDTHHQLEDALGPAGAAANKLHIYDAVKATYGFGDPTSPKTKERGVSGFLQKLTGVGPKFSFFQRNLLSKNQDYVGRSVVGIDPELEMNEIGIPEDMGWKLYAPYIQRRLVRNGVRASDAIRMIRDKDPVARNHMLLEAKERPVMYSRAPSWHKFNVLAGYPKMVPGNTILTNPLVTTGLTLDYDGDTMNVHLPSMPDAVHDAKTKLMPDKMLFSIKNEDSVVPVPKQEMVLGLYTAQHKAPRNTHHFATEEDALAAIHSNRVRMSDEIVIGKKPSVGLKGNPSRGLNKWLSDNPEPGQQEDVQSEQTSLPKQ